MRTGKNLWTYIWQISTWTLLWEKKSLQLILLSPLLSKELLVRNCWNTQSKVCPGGVEIHHEEVYMVQLGGIARKGKKHLVYRLNKSFKGWAKLINNGICIWLGAHLFGFKENTINQCIYLKASGIQFIIIVLYVDDILLANSRVKLLTKTKFMLNSHFDMMDLCLCCSRHSDFCYRSHNILGLF